MTTTVELAGSLHDMRLMSRDPDRRLDKESLLNIPLVRAAFADTRFSLVRRQMDSRWLYGGYCPHVTTGFHPFRWSYFYGTNSAFAGWLADPYGSARQVNWRDRAVKEVIFMAHDYLHAWAYARIDELWPDLDVFHGPLTRKNFDDFLFCHLVSEAVATAGVDYWCLSRREVNSFCPIGSCLGPLTTGYQEDSLDEYRRFNPAFEVQNPAFFTMLAAFYCTGELPGFGADDMRHSFALLNWLEHELTYGKQQRINTREWFAYLSGDDIRFEASQLGDPVSVDDPHRQRVLNELAHRLWDFVADPLSGIDDREVKRAPSRRRPAPAEIQDFCFTNRALLPDAFEVCGPYKKESLQQLMSQMLTRTPFATVPKERRKYITRSFAEGDIELLRLATHDLPKLAAAVDEPEDLFMLP